MIDTIATARTPPALGHGPKPGGSHPGGSHPGGSQPGGVSLWDSDGFGFGDFLDAINPLQHLPVIGSLYREFVGDDIGAIPKLVGGALFAGIPGLIGSAVDTAFEAISGKDIGSTALAFLVGDDSPPIAVAAKTPDPNAASLSSPLALALLTATADKNPSDKKETTGAAMAVQNFALRFDREMGAYRHGLRLGAPNPSSFERRA